MPKSPKINGFMIKFIESLLKFYISGQPNARAFSKFDNFIVFYK